MIRTFLAGVLGSVANRLRGHDVFVRWFRMVGYGLSAFFICPLGVLDSLVIAVLITGGMLPGWPKWEDFGAMGWRGFCITAPAGFYISFVNSWESGWWFIFIGCAIAPCYFIARWASESKWLPTFSIGRGLSHWVEKAELLFGFVLFGALANV